MKAQPMQGAYLSRSTDKVRKVPLLQQHSCRWGDLNSCEQPHYQQRRLDPEAERVLGSAARSYVLEENLHRLRQGIGQRVQETISVRLRAGTDAHPAMGNTVD
jgi:hypothetical protein